MTFPSLTTPRLHLREPAPADARWLFDLFADHEHMQWYGIEPFENLAAAEARIQKLAESREATNPVTSWAIERRDDCSFIGTCGLFAWNRNWRKCSVGFELSKAAQGQGYMREALQAVIPWGFRDMTLNRIEAQTHPNNQRSISLLKRLGFAEEGRLREAAYWAGQYHDMIQFSLLLAEWRQDVS